MSDVRIVLGALQSDRGVARDRSSRVEGRAADCAAGALAAFERLSDEVLAALDEPEALLGALDRCEQAHVDAVLRFLFLDDERAHDVVRALLRAADPIG